MSELSFKCPKCAAQLTVDETAAGTTANCPQCGERLVVPRQSQVNPLRTDDRNITIRLGFGGKEKRPIERPSRRLIFSLVGVWLVLSIASVIGAIAFGYSNGQSRGYQRGQTLGQQTGYEAGRTTGYQEGLVAGGKDSIQRARDEGYAEGYRTGRSEGETAGYTTGRQEGRAEGKETALSALRKINISTGTSAEEVRLYLGTPDKVERYDTGRYSTRADPAPCWVYGSVRIYLDGDYDFSQVTHWTGDLKALLDTKLKRNE